MHKDIQFLQQLQECFVEKLQLSMVITDFDHRQVTVPTFCYAFDEWFSKHRQPLIEADGDMAAQKYLEHINQPVLMNLSVPGIKVIVSPIRVNQVNRYFVWTGIIVQDNAQEAIMSYINARIPQVNVGMDTLNELPQPSIEEIDHILLELAKFSKLSSQFLNVYHNEDRFQSGLRAISRYVEEDQFDQSSIESVLKSWLENNQDIHFCGIAKEIEDKFHIENYFGPGLDLQNAIFTPGEGFLGQAAILNQFREWNNIDKDPRIQFFAQRGMSPHHLFCAPIKAEDRVAGVLFAGSLNRRHPGDDVPLMIQIIARHISAQLNSLALKQSLQQLNTYLMALMEIAKVMHIVQDLKRIQLILVDMSLNLAIGASAGFLILKSTNSNKFQIISRGLSQHSGEIYSRDIANRYFHSKSAGRKDPEVVCTDWEDNVLECPIYSNDELLGVLAVSVKETMNVNEYIPIFSALTCLAGIAIERVIQIEKENRDQHIVSLLFETILNWDKEAYLSAQEAHQLANELTETMDMTQTECLNVATACLLHHYSPEFLRKHLMNRAVPDIIEGIQKPEQRIGTDSDHLASCIVALILAYLKHNNDVSAVHELQYIPEPLRQQFISFVMRKHTVDFEMAIDDDSKENDSFALIDFPYLRQTLKISSREADVLKLIVKGLNNREIAEALFISENTVKNHITNLFQKLEVSDRAQAIALVYKIGFNHNH